MFEDDFQDEGLRGFGPGSQALSHFARSLPIVPRQSKRRETFEQGFRRFCFAIFAGLRLCVSVRMNHTSAASQTFMARANDVACRDFSARSSRFVRAHVDQLCRRGILFAADPRVCTAWKRGWEAEHYVRLLRWRDAGFRPRVIYDIGAHEGRWAEMAQAVFSPERMILFEPQREYQSRARSRQPATHANWTVLPVALGEKDATSMIHVTQNGAATSLLKPVRDIPQWGIAPVRDDVIQVVALDRFAAAHKLPSPDLVKIDVQGYEHRVLEGGSETIGQARRVVIEVSLQELYQEQPLLPKVLQMLDALDFSLEDTNEGTRAWPAPPAQLDLWLKRDP